jgi:hypothetical protein
VKTELILGFLDDIKKIALIVDINNAANAKPTLMLTTIAWLALPSALFQISHDTS